VAAGAEQATFTASVPSPVAAAVHAVLTASAAALHVPPPVTLAAGATAAEAIVTAGAVSALQSAVLTAHLDPTSVTLQPAVAALQSFTVSPASVIGSNTITGTVTLTAPAPAGGYDVELPDYETIDLPPYVKPMARRCALGQESR